MIINNCFGFSIKIYLKKVFVSFLWLTILLTLVIKYAVKKSQQFANLNFYKTVDATARQNDRERAVFMVQAGMTHQVVADNFNVYSSLKRMCCQV
jgi:hypothetical protein